ncbi:MAG: hypothetical protein QOF61_2279 [Acidobacteriota bacterium]|nr:hypothetical protein [Acidobacteriota bacterium]
MKGNLKGKLRRGGRKRHTLARGATTMAGARLTFRAELMPGRSAIERTFQVARVLAGGRVELAGMGGQHAMTEFEPAQV